MSKASTSTWHRDTLASLCADASRNGRANPSNDSLKPSDHVILDLDGTLLRGSTPTDGAHGFLRAIGDRFVLLSNNSRETSRSLSSKLRRVGFDIAADRIILAGEEAVRFVARTYPGARCLIATSPALRHCARRLGLVPVPSNADIVLLGRDTRWSYAKLTLLANEVKRGAILVAANPDLTHPGHDGSLVPETGALLAAVEAASGIAARHVVGKPGAGLFHRAIERLGSAASDTIVVGDNPLTDRAGADALGLRSVIIHPDRRHGRPNLADLCLALRRDQ